MQAEQENKANLHLFLPLLERVSIFLEAGIEDDEDLHVLKRWKNSSYGFRASSR